MDKGSVVHCNRCQKSKLEIYFLFKPDGSYYKTCSECRSKILCRHQRQRSQCVECHGASICAHQVIRSKCRICRPESRILKMLSDRKRLIDPHQRKLNNLKTALWHLRKGTRSHPEVREYIGCTPQFLRHWLDYTKRQHCHSNYKLHLDFLQPIAEIQRDRASDLYEYFNWKNLRIVPKKENLVKHAKEPTSKELEDQECFIADFLDLIVLTA